MGKKAFVDVEFAIRVPIPDFNGDDRAIVLTKSNISNLFNPQDIFVLTGQVE